MILQLRNLTFPESRGKKKNPAKKKPQKTQIHITKESMNFFKAYECLLTVEVIQAIKITLQKSLSLATSYVPDTLFCL